MILCLFGRLIPPWWITYLRNINSRPSSCVLHNCPIELKHLLTPWVHCCRQLATAACSLCCCLNLTKKTKQNNGSTFQWQTWVRKLKKNLVYFLGQKFRPFCPARADSRKSAPISKFKEIVFCAPIGKKHVSNLRKKWFCSQWQRNINDEI